LSFLPGDVLVLESWDAPFVGASLVFYAAGMPEQWQPDESVFDRVNLVGTKEVLARCATRACELAIVFATLAEPMWPERGGFPMPP
jgi:nucleoside-diphosphate-sugar epimerase